MQKIVAHAIVASIMRLSNTYNADRFERTLSETSRNDKSVDISISLLIWTYLSHSLGIGVVDWETFIDTC